MHVRLQMLLAIFLFSTISVTYGATQSASGADTTNGLRYRYAYSADGYNQDRDDVAGSAMVVALFDRLG